MKSIKYLKISFENELHTRDIPLFRGAVAAQAGLENQLFHNHSEGDTFRYSYPLIQYKALFRKASIVCLERGTEEIYHFFQQPNPSLQLGNQRSISIKIADLSMREHVLQAHEGGSFHYTIHRWLPLQGDNYTAYTHTTDLAARIQHLNAILRGNILSMGKGLDCYFDNEVKAHITDISPSYLLTYKGVRMTTFDASFTTNVALPNFIGLGKGAAMGYGVVRQEHQ